MSGLETALIAGSALSAVGSVGQVVSIGKQQKELKKQQKIERSRLKQKQRSEIGKSYATVSKTGVTGGSISDFFSAQQTAFSEDLDLLSQVQSTQMQQLEAQKVGTALSGLSNLLATAGTYSLLSGKVKPQTNNTNIISPLR